MRILIVEDDVSINQMMKLVLEQEGFDVATAGNGQQALQHLSETADKPELILLDHRMPEMDGSEFMEAIRKDRTLSSIPIVSLTGLDSPPTVGPVLRKPFQVEELLAVISEYCTRNVTRCHSA